MYEIFISIIVIILALGADMISIGRGFMMSAGCIRARVCSGAGKLPYKFTKKC